MWIFPEILGQVLPRLRPGFPPQRQQLPRLPLLGKHLHRPGLQEEVCVWMFVGLLQIQIFVLVLSILYTSSLCTVHAGSKELTLGLTWSSTRRTRRFLGTRRERRKSGCTLLLWRSCLLNTWTGTIFLCYAKSAAKFSFVKLLAADFDSMAHLD